MYLSKLWITNFRQFGAEDPKFCLTLNEGVTALVGENDAGKTAVIDAIRHVLLTRDVDYMRLQVEDFHIRADGSPASDITICCKFSKLSTAELGSFVEYLTYDGEQASLYVHFYARRLSEAPCSRRWVEVIVRSGPDGSGPTFDSAVRQLLAAAYLRPLRDAEREMSPGRGSRLSQILNNVPEIRTGTPFDKATPPSNATQVNELSLVGLSDYIRHQVDRHAGVSGAQHSINESYLSNLSLAGENLQGRISFTEGGNEPARLRQILERLELDLLEGPDGVSRGNYGLGSNNLLFMACELLLLGSEPDGLPLLLIEEPEAHLHPQRQLRLMEFLEAASTPSADQTRRPVQVIVTTHSPNLASKISLNNLVLLRKQRAYSLGIGETRLSKSDYRFLQRFLDVTKANLFFSRGVLIVEGDAEAILLPTIAKLIDRDLTKYGVSVVNVGGTGLRRYSRILQRHDVTNGTIGIPVACVSDMDVMPDCAPEILGLVSSDADLKWTSTRRRWKTKKHFGGNGLTQDQALKAQQQKLAEDDAQSVKTFVANEWTLEYDLAFSGLAKEVYTAASLAHNDDPLNENKKTPETVSTEAAMEFSALVTSAAGSSEVLCSHIYEMFSSNHASKAISAQYLSELLSKKMETAEIDVAWLITNLPSYLIAAIEHVTEPYLPEEPALTPASP